MKRELKLVHRTSVRNLYWNCKAYPDEKGIETLTALHQAEKASRIAKPIPMKRELKRHNLPPSDSIYGRYCKAYPDEKGIQTPRVRRLQTNPIILTASQVKTEFRVIVRINQF